MGLNLRKEEGMLKGSSLLETLEYGPAPESDDAAKAWIRAHDGGKFGLFINNEFVHPAGRTYTPTYNAARDEPLAEIMEGHEVEDVQVAVEAAKKSIYNLE